MTFLSAYLAARHVPAVLISAVWALVGLSAVAAPALWSRPIATWTGTRALAVLLAAVAVAALLPLLHLSPYMIALSAATFGLTFMSVPAAVTASAAGHAGETTGPLAALTVIFAIGQSAGPWLVGLLVDRISMAAALGWTAALCAAAALLVTPAQTMKGHLRHSTARR